MKTNLNKTKNYYSKKALVIINDFFNKQLDKSERIGKSPIKSNKITIKNVRAKKSSKR